MNGYSTGYFAKVDNERSKVHIVHDSKPICGCKVTGEYQWCSFGIHIDLVECENCLKWYETHVSAIITFS